MANDRRLQDRLCAANAPDEITARVADLLAEAAALLEPFDGELLVAEAEALFVEPRPVPGDAQPLCPAAP